MLTKEEMLKVEGGINWSRWSFIGGGIALIAGIIDGLTKP